MDCAATLNRVKSWMRSFGWSNDGGPGSVKRIEGSPCAYHGDATWIADMEEACRRAERDAIVEEIERRAHLFPNRRTDK